MDKKTKIIAILGTYRKGGVIDTAVAEILAAAEQAGAETAKIYLIDKSVEFCTNCRSCGQLEGPNHGACAIADDMPALLDEIEQADGLVLASPMNFGTVTAVMKRFIERLVCFAYWPWGQAGPKMRNKRKTKVAVLVASSAAPSLMARVATKMIGLMKKTAGVLGARTIGVLFIGLAAQKQDQWIGERARKKAHVLGRKLAAACRKG
jgi:multimeric flavodoxin WrbA